MRPPPAVARRVGIAVPVGVLMMDTMGCDPKERTALQCECATDGQDTFEPPRCLVPAMREQAVIPHADAPAACDPKQGQCDPKCLPSEKEKRRQRSRMKQCQGTGCDPIQSRRVIGHAPRGGTSFVPSIAREGATTIVPLHLCRSSSNCSHSFA